MKYALRAWCVFSTVLLALLTVLAWKLPPGFVLTAVGDVVQTLLLLTLTIVMVANVVVTHGRVRFFWILNAFGAGLWFGATALWTVYEVFLEAPAPMPFGGDVLIFIHIVPFMAAMALSPHLRDSDRRMQFGTIDFMLLVSWWVFLYLLIVIPWQYVQLSPKTYGFNFDVLYVIENAILVAAIAVVWMRSSGAWKKVYLNLFIASALYLFAAQAANAAITRGGYYTGSLYDIPLTLASCWFVGTAILAYRTRPEPVAGERARWQAVVIARLAMVAALSLPVLGFIGSFLLRPPHRVLVFRLVVTFAAMFVLSLFLFFKQHVLDRELVNLLKDSEHNFETLKRLQAQLVQSEKLSALGQLVAGAAHEINNPVTAIMGYSDLLASDSTVPPQAADVAKKINAQARRTGDLVRDLLKFAKQHPTEKAQVDMNAIVTNAIELHQLDSDSGVHFITQLDPTLPLVCADSSQLLQVCFNIIGNAVEAMRELGGGVLTVKSWCENGQGYVEFSDTGPGLKEPKRIFDPFYTTKPVGRGTGLGLSAAYGIIQAHGGQIICENREPRGATFRLLLPLTRVQAHAAAAN